MIWIRATKVLGENEPSDFAAIKIQKIIKKIKIIIKTHINTLGVSGVGTTGNKKGLPVIWQPDSSYD
jgi:pimeloyl-CoA synthetase